MNNIDKNKENYNKYLKSDIWKNIKENYFKKFDKKCVRCGSLEKLNLHHLNYEILNPKKFNEDFLVCLCEVCHLAVHDSKQNPKAIGDPKRSKLFLTREQFINCAVPIFYPAKLSFYEKRQFVPIKKIKKPAINKVYFDSRNLNNDQKYKKRLYLLDLLNQSKDKELNAWLRQKIQSLY